MINSGVTNSVAYNYDHLAVVSFKYDNDEEVLMALLDEAIEPVEFETNEGVITISVNPNDISKTKDVLEKLIPNIDYEVDEVGMYAKDLVTLEGEDKELFIRLYNLLDEIEDVSEIYHNVNIDL